jgi:VanZ family protein
MLLLLGSSVIPMDRQIRGLQFVIDLKPTLQNLLHIPMFAVLALLLLLVLQSFQIDNWKKIAIVLLASGFLGLVTEIIQIVVPGRFGGLTDLMLNFVGVILGLIVYYLFGKSKAI